MTMQKEEICHKLKELIVETLNLEEMSAADIETEAPLFREGLGLDSIDALELGLGVKKAFKVKLSAEDEHMREHFYSVSTLADYIIAQRPEILEE